MVRTGKEKAKNQCYGMSSTWRGCYASMWRYTKGTLKDADILYYWPGMVEVSLNTGISFTSLLVWSPYSVNNTNTGTKLSILLALRLFYQPVPFHQSVQDQISIDGVESRLPVTLNIPFDYYGVYKKEMMSQISDHHQHQHQHQHEKNINLPSSQG